MRKIGNLEYIVDNTINDGKLFTCVECNKRFTHLSSLAKHSRLEHIMINELKDLGDKQ